MKLINRNKMGKIIAVINDKGGVAKTTTVMNLGTALWLLGKKVLLVDNDPQSNLTIAADRTAYGQDQNLYAWMMIDKNIDAPVFERYDGLDYIPASPMMGKLEKELDGKPYADRRLGLRLNPLRKMYDYILIDCSPAGDSILNLNALDACDEMIIPIGSDIFSVQGRVQLVNKILEYRAFGKDLKVAGVLLTQYKKNTEMGKTVREHFKRQADTTTQVGSDANTQERKDTVEMPLFPVAIRECESVNKALSKQMSIFEYYANATAADDYMRLAEYMLGINPRKKNWTPKQWREKSRAAFEEFIATQGGKAEY